MIGANINSYFKAAMNYPVERLVAVMQGKDNSIPQAAAMMALQIKKPMVDAAAGQEAMNRPQQPSVKQQMEQEVAMLPENVGIMNLPVQQEYADGGIVAFGPGGSTTLASKPELNAQTIRELYRTDPRLAREAIDRVTDIAERRRLLGAVGIPGLVADTGFGLSTAAADTMSNMTPEQRRGFYDNNVFGGAMSGDAGVAGAILNAPQMAPPKADYFGGLGKAITTPFRMLVGDPSLDAEKRVRERKIAERVSPVYPDETSRGTAASLTATPAASPTQFVDARTAPPAAPGAGKGKGAGAAGPKKEAAGPKKEATAASAFTPGKETDLATELAKVQNVMPDVERLYGGLAGDVESAFAERARVRELGKPKGQAYEGLEKLLAEEKGEAKGKADKLFNRALVTSGLAIAGGDSQYALQNIARGSEVGNKQYMAGIEKLEEAAKERRRQATAIEEARRAEARGDWKEQQQFMDRAMEAQLNIKRDQITGIMNITGKSVETASGIVNAQNQTVSQEKRALLQAQTELETRRMADEAALQRVREQVAGQKAIYGGARDPVNIATDNAAKEYEIWQKSSAGTLAGMDQAKQDAAKRQIYNEVFKRSGLPLPYPVGGGVVPPPVGGGRFIGFETQ